MALKIRLQRHGASHRPFYRMVVTEALARRDGRFVEVLGTYEPQAKRAEDELSVKLDRVDYWKSVGAKPTDTAASLIRKARREAPKVLNNFINDQGKIMPRRMTGLTSKQQKKIASLIKKARIVSLLPFVIGSN